MFFLSSRNGSVCDRWMQRGAMSFFCAEYGAGVYLCTRPNRHRRKARDCPRCATAVWTTFTKNGTITTDEKREKKALQQKILCNAVLRNISCGSSCLRQFYRTESSNPAMISPRPIQRDLVIFSLRIRYPRKAPIGRLNWRNAWTKLTLLTWFMASSTRA